MRSYPRYSADGSITSPSLKQPTAACMLHVGDMEMIKHSIRQATVSDAAIIARHRVGMFRDMGQVPTDALAATLLETSTAALDALLRERSYVGWLAIAEGD